MWKQMVVRKNHVEFYDKRYAQHRASQGGFPEATLAGLTIA